MRERIRKAVSKALTQAGTGETMFTVEQPNDLAYGDYATNAALMAAKTFNKDPRKLADELARNIKNFLGEAERVEVAGPGFINITLSRDAIAFVIAEADAQGPMWGKGSESVGQRVMVEYSNPNTFKEMHIGHLVGTIIGESISRLVENGGAEIKRDTFGGDVGPNVAKALWALRKAGITEIENAKQIGAAYVEGSRAYEESPEAKTEIDEINKVIYMGVDTALMDLWRRGREVSMEEFRRIWRIVGSHFDYEFFDSDTTKSALRLVRDGLARGIFKESDGAVIYDGKTKGVHTMVFITSHGTPTYEAKDIGLAFLREERWPSDRVIIVTGNEQNGRFKTVFAALAELAPKIAAKTSHIGTGFLRLTSGKMSSRGGDIITASDLIKEIVEKASERNADPLIAEQVALGAIKYMILRQSPGSDITFDAKKSLSLEGDSGPYLQYALVRARKILAYAGGEIGTDTPPAPYIIERLMTHFPEVVARAASELAPNVLITYLTELASAWNSLYAAEQILGSSEEAYKQRVARAFVNTMTNGLALLGIPAPEKM